MRPLFPLVTGVAALSLTVLLSACGGGGGGGSKLAPVPVGTLTFTGSSSGTFVVATSVSQLNGSTTIHVDIDGTPTFKIITNYETTGIAVTDVQVNVGSSSSPGYAGYACSASTTVCNGMALDKAARTLTFTNAKLQGASSAEVTINGTVTWPAP